MNYTIRDLQATLRSLGYDPGPIDGLTGPKTRSALAKFQSDNSLPVNPSPTPQDWKVLLAKSGKGSRDTLTTALDGVTPPWMDQMMAKKGLHEGRDFDELYRWLKSAGISVNPKTTPWCGDAVETAILRALPDEPLPSNPAASINWLPFGTELKAPSYGAVLIFWRGKPDGWQGHIGFYVGEDSTHYHVLGGNQSDRISVTRIAKNRLRKGGIRWPTGYPLPTSGVIMRKKDGLVVTENEA